MKILATGDWHIGAGVDEDVRASVSEIIVDARNRGDGISLIVINGDVYEGDTSPEDRNLAASLIAAAADVASVIIIKGNHDAVRDLDILGRLASRNKIEVFDRPTAYGYPLLDPGVMIHFLPWFSKSQWVALNPGATIDESNRAVGALVVDYLRAVVAGHPEYKHFLFGHLTVHGAKAENHQPLLGEGVTIGYEDLVDCGFAGGVFGHIHLRQSFGEAGHPQFHYPGAVAALNYGEVSDDKGYAILDTDTGLVTMHNVECPRRVVIDAEWDSHLSYSYKAGADLWDAYLKVKLLIAEGYKSDDGRAAVRATFEQYSPRDLKIETQSRPRQQLRAPEIAKAQTACQKLEACWKATNSTPPEPMRSLVLAHTAELEAKCYLAK